MNILNSKIWDNREKLHVDIKTKLLEISKLFFKKIETPIKLKNIFLTGSLASYQWRPTSDFDLHIVVEILDDECVETAVDYFDSKSKIFNTEHNIFLKGYKVEVNIKTEESLLKGKGVYDIINDEWVAKPEKPSTPLDDPEVLKIAEKIKMEIDDAISNQAGLDTLKEIRNKIKNLRTQGLAKDGEYSIGNLVFKKLRHDEYIKKLYDYKAEVENERLSLESKTFKTLFEKYKEHKNVLEEETEGTQNPKDIQVVETIDENISEILNFLKESDKRVPQTKKNIVNINNFQNRNWLEYYQNQGGYDGGDAIVSSTAVALNAPSIPLNLTATPQDRKILLSWNPPINDGNSPITEYEIYHSANTNIWNLSNTVTVFPPNTGFTTNTLINGTNYWIGVKAKNAIGLSPLLSAGPFKPNLLLTISPASISGMKQQPVVGLEFIEIYNPHPYDGDLTGWYLISHENPPTCNIGAPPQQYNFPANTIIPAGSYTRVYSGSSANINVPLYWTNAFMWFDDGDIADLYDYSNRWIDTLITGECLSDVAGYDINFTASAGRTVTTIPLSSGYWNGFTASDLTRGAGMTNGDGLTVGWIMREILPASPTLAVALSANETVDFSATNGTLSAFEINGFSDLRLNCQANAPTRAALVFNKDNNWNSYTTIFDVPLVSPATFTNNLTDISIIGFKNNITILNAGETGYFRFVFYAANGITTSGTRNISFANQDIFLQVMTPFYPPV